MSKGNGIESKGKTQGKQLGISGSTVSEFTGKGGGSGKTNANMKKLGRNLAKIAAQKRG